MLELSRAIAEMEGSPDGIIGLRLSRTRREEYVDAASTYRSAVISRVAFERAAKRKAKKGTK